MENTNSFKAGVEAAKSGISIDNSYPFNHEEWCRGYRTIKPNVRCLFDSVLESGTSQEKLEALIIIELSKNG